MSHPSASTQAARIATVLTLTATLLSGCLSSADCSAGTAARTFRGMLAAAWRPMPAAASCAAGITFKDQFMVAWSARLPAPRGKPLGTAIYPPCNDGGGCSGEVDTAEGATKVWALRGFDTDEVVVARSEGGRQLVVYARLHADPDTYFRFTGGSWHLRTPKGSR